FLALADRIDWCDRAAPVARRLAAGVGGRVATPRSTVGRMGSARLAEQTGLALGLDERLLGSALATTAKMGGRNVSRLALWRAHAAEESWLYFDRRAHTCARHRGQRRHVQHRGRLVAAAPAV